MSAICRDKYSQRMTRALLSLDVLLVQSAVGCLVPILDFFDYETFKSDDHDRFYCTFCLDIYSDIYRVVSLLLYA